MSPGAQELWRDLGWDGDNWDAGSPRTELLYDILSWSQLSATEKSAAKLLGYDSDRWNDDDATDPDLFTSIMYAFLILAAVGIAVGGVCENIH